MKISYINHSIEAVYSPKKYIDGRRYEENIELGDDYKKISDYLRRIPVVDAVMLKYSYKWIFINHITNQRIKLNFECCYAFNPENASEYAEPYYFLEVEEKNGLRLEEFEASDYFKRTLSPYLLPGGIEFRKSMLCKKHFDHKYFSLQEPKQIKKYVKQVFSHVDRFSKPYDAIIQAPENLLRVKGEKKSERGERLEKEIKFIPSGSQEDVLNCIRPYLKENWTLIKVKPRIITDIYFDTDDYFLYHHRSNFRIRNRQKKDGWISCCKLYFDDRNGFLARNTWRSSITTKEALLFNTNRIPGKAYQKLQEYLTSHNRPFEACGIRPVIMVSQIRERYVIRPFDCLSQTELMAQDTVEVQDEQYLHQTGEMINIMFDNVKAYDLRQVPAEKLLRFQEIDVTEKAIKTAEYYTAEIEPSERIDLKDEALALFEALADVIPEKGNLVLYQDKYSLAADQLFNL